MKYYIITGASRGLGEALIYKLMHKDNHIICLSKKYNDKLVKTAKELAVNFDYFEFDLNNLMEIEDLMSNIFNLIDKNKVDSIYLINNAGVVKPIGPIEKCQPNEVVSNINVNLTAPILLTSLFIRHTEAINKTKRVINISSGAGKKPYFGWSNYCSAKAGLDLFTQCVGVEQLDNEFPVDIVSFAPGIIDTDMQKEIRNAKEEDFIQLQRFIEFKETGKLKSPADVADIVLKVLNNKEQYNGTITDISNF